MEEHLAKMLGVSRREWPHHWYPVGLLGDRILLNWHANQRWWTVLYSVTQERVLSAATPPPGFVAVHAEPPVDRLLVSHSGHRAVAFFPYPDDAESMGVVVTDGDFEIVDHSGIGGDQWAVQRTDQVILSSSGDRIALLYQDGVEIASMTDGVWRGKIAIPFPRIAETPHPRSPNWQPSSPQDFMSWELAEFSDDSRFLCLIREAQENWFGDGAGDFLVRSRDYELVTIDCTNGSASRWSLPDWKEPPRALLFSADEGLFAVITSAGQVGVVEVETGEFRSQFSPGLSAIIGRQVRVMGGWIVTLQGSGLEILNWEGESLLRADLPATGEATYPL